jgi:hypothetical protein
MSNGTGVLLILLHQVLYTSQWVHVVLFHVEKMLKQIVSSLDQAIVPFGITHMYDIVQRLTKAKNHAHIFV